MALFQNFFEEPIPGVLWRTIKTPTGNWFKDFAKTEGYHELDVEDCYHKRQIAKVVERDGYVFVVVKIAHFEAKALRLTFDDFDMFIKTDSLVTVEEHPGALIDHVRKRFPRTADHKIDTHHLVYALLDEIVDYYLVTLDSVGESIHSLEGEIWRNPTPKMLERIFKMKRFLIDFRRNAGGMREVVSLLVRHPRVKTDGDLENYYRDLYEHTIRVIEFVETYRDTLNSSLDVYLSAVAQKTNEVSKVLAVYGTIALPFLVLTGLYGMNIPLPFQESPHAFFIVFGSMAILAMVALYFFKRKNWF